MDRGLVNVGATEMSHRLLQEAAEHAVGADAELVLLSILTEEEYDHDLEAIDRIENLERIDLGEHPRDIARSIGERIAETVLDPYDIEFTVVGRYVQDEIVQTVLTEATDRNCDHIYLLGRRRSRFGAIFTRDPLREALNEFDGFVTIGRERNPERKFVKVPEEQYGEEFVEFYGNWW